MLSKQFDFEPVVRLGDRAIGGGAPCIIVAEIGPNHNGDVDTARALIQAAAEAGCDAVKFQYRIVEAELFDRDTRSYYFDEPRYDFIKRVQEFPHAVHRQLRQDARSRGLLYICSAMSEEAVERIATLEPDAIKIPSGEVGNPWLLEAAARLGVPAVASSGMSPQAEIDTTMRTLNGSLRQVVILHCVSEYPTDREDMNLRMIPYLAKRYGCPAGLSDHSRNISEIGASVALGAAMIETHFTFDRDAVGPDHHISLLPREMESLVQAVRGLEQALGQPEKVLGRHADQMRQSFTNSIVARRDLKAGDVLDRTGLALKKPGTGLGPDALPRIIGKRLARDVSANTPLSWEDIE